MGLKASLSRAIVQPGSRTRPDVRRGAQGLALLRGYGKPPAGPQSLVHQVRVLRHSGAARTRIAVNLVQGIDNAYQRRVRGRRGGSWLGMAPRDTSSKRGCQWGSSQWDMRMMERKRAHWAKPHSERRSSA